MAAGTAKPSPQGAGGTPFRTGQGPKSRAFQHCELITHTLRLSPRRAGGLGVTSAPSGDRAAAGAGGQQGREAPGRAGTSPAGLRAAQTPPGLRNGAGEGRDSSALSSEGLRIPTANPRSPLPSHEGTFPSLGRQRGAGGRVRGRLFPQAGRAAGGLRGKDRGRGRVPPLPAAPASEPGGQGPTRGTTKPPSPPGAGLRAAARASPSPSLPLLTRRAPAPAAARSSIVPLPPPRRQSRHGNERHRGARGGAFGY